MTQVRDDLRPVQRRLVIAAVAAGMLLLVLVGRLWVLQILQGEQWRKFAESNRLRRVPLEAPRGTVTDVNGEVILDNRPTYQLLLFPEEMRNIDGTKNFLTQLNIASVAEIHARIQKARATSHLPSILADNLTWPQMATISAHRADYPELEIHPATRRALPAGPTVAHLVGQLGEVTPAQLVDNPRLRSGQLVGRSGLEKAYQNILGGISGNLVVVVDALGRQVSTKDEESPVAGHSLQTTINLSLQREAADAMAGQVGAVVAIDPRDGAVRVLLSTPAFDPDLFAGHLEPAKWQELMTDPLNPLSNRSLQALYPPGSTIKPLFAAGGLADRVITPGRSAFCTGAVNIYGHPYRCWLKGGHGRVDLFAAIEVSCDTFFYQLARDAGIDRLAKWARTFGLGQNTNIEIAGENSGLVPDDDWSRRARGHSWYGGETISVGIGQGPILATPIQLAIAYSALVNGGFLYRPHLVAGQGARSHKLDLPTEVLAEVRRGMELVVSGDRGTARRLASLPVTIGGKTGTSQVIRKQEGMTWQELPWEQRHHALFIGYAPVDNPQLVVAVVVEHGGDAASVAAPIAGRILQRAFSPNTQTTFIASNISLPGQPVLAVTSPAQQPMPNLQAPQTPNVSTPLPPPTGNERP